MSPIGIISALPSEAQCFAGHRLPLNEPVPLNDHTIIIICGIGAERAQKAAENLIAMKITGLISWGTAGGLVDTLRSGDLILPHKVISPSGQVYLTEPVWIQQIQAHLSATSTVIYQDHLATSDKILTSSKEKIDYQKKTEAIAVDMESAAIATVAMAENIPFIAIRAIVDEIDRTIPQCVLNNTDPYGQPDIVKILANLLKSPQQIASLYYLYQAMNKATRTLTTVANRMKDSS